MDSTEIWLIGWTRLDQKHLLFWYFCSIWCRSKLLIFDYSLIPICNNNLNVQNIFKQELSVGQSAQPFPVKLGSWQCRIFKFKKAKSSVKIQVRVKGLGQWSPIMISNSALILIPFLTVGFTICMPRPGLHNSSPYSSNSWA
jgi:hypothetical protein